MLIVWEILLTFIVSNFYYVSDYTVKLCIRRIDSISVATAEFILIYVFAFLLVIHNFYFYLIMENKFNDNFMGKSRLEKIYAF